jgi:hypothetical protein
MKLKSCLAYILCAAVLCGCVTTAVPPKPTEDPGQGYEWSYNRQSKNWERISEARAEQIRQQEAAERKEEQEKIRQQTERASRITETDINGLFESAADLEGTQVRLTVPGPLGFKSGGKADLVPAAGRMLRMKVCKSKSTVKKMHEEYGLTAVPYKSKELKEFNEARNYSILGLVTGSGVTNYISMGAKTIPSGQYKFVALDVLSIE